MSTDNLLIIQPDQSKNRMHSLNKIKIAYKSASPTYSSIEGNMEDITISRLDIFSNAGNVNGDHFFLDTTKLDDENFSNKNKYIINNLNNSRCVIRNRASMKKRKRNNNVDISIDKNNES
jgi:hypothetical protein